MSSAVFPAIYLGLRETLLVGGAMYLCALLVLRLTKPRVLATPEVPEPHFVHS